MKKLISMLLVIAMAISLAPTAFAASTGFTDVEPGSWYEEAVSWAVEEGITTGLSETTFGPTETCVRAQVVTFLWRSQGKPEPAGDNNPFTDVTSNDYFYKAVLWAVEEGITTGTSATTFGPNDPCTRGQVVTFLWRAMGKPQAANRVHNFSDVKYIEIDLETYYAPYYYDAVLWAVEEGITNGTTATTFSPDNACNRGQIVCFLFRTPSPNELRANIDRPAKTNSAVNHVETLSVTVNGGQEPYTYQWKLNGKNIDDPTANAAKLHSAEAGLFSCVVTDANGITTETSAVEIVNVEYIDINKTILQLKAGETYQLKSVITPDHAAEIKLSWGTDNPYVATVSNTGLVTAVSDGVAKIHFNTVQDNYNGFVESRTCTVLVGDCGVKSVSMDYARKYVSPGKSFKLKATVSPSDASYTKLVWNSDDTSILTVDEYGNVETTGKEGMATVTATALNGVAASCKVYVYNEFVLYKPDGTPAVVDSSEIDSYLDNGWGFEKGLDIVAQGNVDVSSQSISWVYGSNTLYVGSDGKTPSYSSAPWKAYQSQIETAYYKRGTTLVSSFSFKGYSALRHVEIPNTVSEIDSYAFNDCYLERIGIPASVSTINKYAFDTYAKPYQSGNKNVVIYCEPGSAAEAFATKNQLSYVYATLVYSDDGRTCMVSDDELDLYLSHGWYTSPMATVYQMDGTEKVIPEDQLDSYIDMGWYADKSEIMTLVYNTKGETKSVLMVNADKMEGEGWYAYPVSIVYAADGSEKVVPTDKINEYLNNGYYKTKEELYVTMYALDGRSKQVLRANVAAEQAVGWYLYDDYMAALAKQYSYLAGNDFRSVRRDYPHAVGQYAYVIAYVDTNGDLCILTYISYKIISNYTHVTMHNISTGRTITDPYDYYSDLADYYYGATALRYMDLAGDALSAEIKANNAMISILKNGIDPGTGAYVNAATLNM